jgi:hypothetical protein
MTSNANSSDTIRVRDKVLMRVMAKMVQIYNGVVEKLKKWDYRSLEKSSV